MMRLPFDLQLLNACAALLLLLSFSMLSQRRVVNLVNLLAMQGGLLFVATLLLARRTGEFHLYLSAALTLALKVVGLSNRAKHYPRQLSGGQEQRVGIARAIVTDPTLLLCDEPTGDLDRRAGDEILDLLHALNQEHGKTIIMVTHDPRAAERASRVLHLEKGALTEAAV
jgi:predicted ABC-type transport system involved in lysophospholipase L1 biosynthesis ATPase subunit